MFSGDENSISFSSLQAKAGQSSILKKIRNQFYKSGNDPELKRYWMPDSNSRECYDCSEKFTTIRRKHHCRVCGQIFCNKCCKGDIPGNLIGYSSTTNLRACNYCYKIVTSFSKNNLLNSSNASLNVPRDYNTRISSSQVTPTSTSITSSRNIKERFRIGEGSESLNTLRVSESERKSNNDDSTSKSSPLPRARTTSPIFTFERKSSIGFREEDYVKSSPLLSDSLNNKSPYALYQTDGTISESFYGSAANLAGQSFKPRVSTSSHEGGSSAPIWVRDLNLTHESFDDKYSDSYSSSEIEISNSKRNIESEACDDYNEPISRTDKAQTSNLNNSGFEIEFDLKNELVSAFKSTQKETKPTFTFTVEPVIESRTVSPYDDIGIDDNLVYTQPSVLVTSPIMDLFDSSKVSKNLDTAFDKLVTKLLIQLLDKENLLHTWVTPIKNLAQKVAHTVSPNCISEKDEMDIQQYVKMKKIPGGSKSDSMIVNGLVISKNVTHRKMNQNINNPKILLLSCPIVYHQRAGQKLTTLDSILLQEHNYLKNLVIKISTYNPDIVVVDKTFARTAKEILLDLGITLVCNVKSSVLEKIARFTGAEIVNSIEAQIGPPQLGHCEKFYVKCFNDSKTLMFFEGCPPEVGCTVVLRGSQSEVILKKVKNIFYFIIYCYYNWRLERSLLIALYAFPPSGPDDAKSSSEDEQQNVMKENSNALIGVQDEPNDLKSSWTTIEDESDPLRLMASDAEKGPSPAQIISPSNLSPPLSKPLSEDSLSKKVSQFLSNTILVCSPFIEIDLPYFLSEEGSMCPLKRYFDIENSFWFKRFKNESSSKKKENLLEVEEATLSSDIISQPVDRIKHHSFITRDLKHNLASTNTLDLLADFRARGSAYPKTRRIICNENSVSIIHSEPFIDPLNERYHQRLPILYFSFSYSSALSPFCLNPWIVIMEFYGSRDISLGTFLEKYCFLPTYSCPATGCSAPMVEHIRKFVHGKGAIHISLKQITNDMDSVETDIITWSVCQKCRTSSPISILSKDARSLSFAKFLELKLYGDKYGIRVPGFSSECTQHSLFHDHTQYFAYKKIAAAFKYQQITISEVTLPSPKIKLNSSAHSSSSSSNLSDVAGPIDQTILSAKPLTVLEKPTVILNENDFGSIIAYSLSTPEYEKLLSDITRASASPCTKKKLLTSLESNGSSVLSEVKDSQFEVSIGSSGVSFNSKVPINQCSNIPHINLQFSHATTEFHCCVYFADQFRKLRSELIVLNNNTKQASTTSLSQPPSTTSYLNNNVEEAYIKSLSCCIPWVANGGKSGARFCKTADDRFILKEMKKAELHSFLSIAKCYFDYVIFALNQSKPTLLAKIFGIYKISFKNTTNSISKMYLLVMENLFYDRNISLKYDLKGSVRNRLASTDTDNDVVLLDENLITIIRETPFYVRSHTKKILQHAIDNDSSFLSFLSIMDYSLLVGVDEDRQDFVVGIIDYIRPYTWDKKIEMMVKSVGGHGMPTIVSPDVYKERFCDKMGQYFLCAPDRWYRLESLDKPFARLDSYSAS